MTRIDADWLTSPASRAVCDMLENVGYRALFVGGCVRNALLGAPVSDLDISTDARPERVMELAKQAGLNAVPTGIEHGTITVISETIPFEITTFRRDVATDGRRAVVAFSDNIVDDAKRRDFTMNALYADSSGQVIDPLGGLPDLNARVFRFIDDADARIREDYLRILRFFRFHAWYGDRDAGIDADGLAACAANIEGISQLSAERIGHELRKLLSAPDPAPALASMQACGALAQALPGAVADQLAILIHMENIAGIEPDPILRLAMIGGENPQDRLRLSKQEQRVLALLRTGLETDTKPAELAYRHGENTARDVVLLRASLFQQPDALADIPALGKAANQRFPVRARDLTDMIKGAEIGTTLRRLEQIWIDADFEISRDDLLSHI